MTTVSLCNTCNQAISDIISGNLVASRWRNPERLSRCVDFRLGDNFKLIRNHQSNACTLCSEAYRRMSFFEASVFEPLESPRSTPYFYSYPKEPVAMPRQELLPLTIRGDTGPTGCGKKLGRAAYFEFYRCGTYSDKPETQQEILELDVDLSTSLECRLGTHKIGYSGSPEAMKLMATWSSECLRRHPRCAIRDTNQLLPKRVLDIGPSDHSEDGFQYPRLVIPNGRRARYACLSYRWGLPTQQYRTTRENIHEHLIHIPMNRLPQTFQDTINLVRYLGLRYLWIDCLCIVQDDDRDWKEQCNRMADIFEKSFVTISALGAENSASGLFQSCDTTNIWKLYLRTRDGVLLGLRPSFSMLAEDLRRSEMSSRGWILQEKILSPALAHFGGSQIHWECRTGIISEVCATSLFPINNPLKFFLHEAQRPGLETYAESHFIAWYMLVQEYSRKTLTFESDRLPAILGLARRFQKSFGATFVAGLWLEDLHRGLLWHKYRYDQRKRIDISEPGGLTVSATSSATCPSWSWIGSAGCDSSTHISFEWDKNIPNNALVSMKPVKRVASNSDLQLLDAWTFSHPELRKGALRGILQIWGVVRKVRVVVDDEVTIVRRLILGRRKSSRRSQSYGLRDASYPLSGPDVICRLDFDCSKNFDCHLLIVADWIFEDTFKGFFGSKESPLVELRGFLLLNRVNRRRRNHNPLDLGQFERVGMGFGVISHMERLCGFSNKKKYLTIR